MADEPSEKLVTLVYEGGPATIVELEREVRGGDEIEDVPAGLAGRLLHAHGFSLAEGHDIDDDLKPADPLPPPPPSGYRLEDLERDQAIAAGEIDPTAPIDPPAEGDQPVVPLADRKADELRELASASGVEGTSKMTKDELVAALEGTG